MLVGSFNQEKALVGAFSVIVQLRRLIVYSTTYEVPEVDGEVAAEQRLAAGDGEQRGQQLAVELGLEHDEAAVHARAAQVGRVLGQVHLPQPLHHSEHRDTVSISFPNGYI